MVQTNSYRNARDFEQGANGYHVERGRENEQARKPHIVATRLITVSYRMEGNKIAVILILPRRHENCLEQGKSNIRLAAQARRASFSFLIR